MALRMERELSEGIAACLKLCVLSTANYVRPRTYLTLTHPVTLAEKTNLTAGTGIYMGRCVGNTGSALRAGIPQLCLQDGPLGVRNTDHNTAFPAGITVGATWDKDLMYRRSVAIGEEFRGKGVNVALAPSVGPLGRKARGGRSMQSP